MRTVDALRGALHTWYGDSSGALGRAYGLTDSSDVPAMLRRIWGDTRYGAPARALARLLTAQGERVYRYHFTRAGLLADGSRGAAHSAEIPFAFANLDAIPPSARTRGDSVLADAMSDYWVAFATSGEPNGRPGAGGWPQWPAYDARRDDYLELGAEILARRGLRTVQYDVLDALARSRGAIRP